jgi:hypothetical protein
MNKIYHVIIKGRTLESRNIRELLARAVSEKRKLDRDARFHSQFQRQAAAKTLSNAYNQAHQAMVM